jgi:flagellar hook assembly protein FlgD
MKKFSLPLFIGQKVNFNKILQPRLLFLSLFLIINIVALFSSPEAIYAQEVDVVWVDLVGVTAAGNTISKSAGTGWGNGGAASGQTISADGWVEFGVVEIDTYRMCGLSDSNLDAHYTSIDYAVYLYNGAVYAFENGTNKGSFGAYQSGDRFRVERTGSTVVYKKNGVVFYTSTVASSGTLMADAAVYTVGGTVADAKIGIIINPPDAVDDLTAVSGSEQITLSWSTPADNGAPISEYEVQYGTVTSGLFDNIYTDDAVPGATISGLTGGVEYQFRVVSRNTAGTSGFSNVVSNVPLATIPVIWKDIVGAVAAGNMITKTASDSSWETGGAASVQWFNGDGAVDFLVTQYNTERVCGLSNYNKDAKNTTIGYGIYLNGLGTLSVIENGVNRNIAGVYYSINDRLAVERIGTTVTYKKNGVVFYTGTVPSTGPLLVDAAIRTTNGVIADVILRGITAGVPDPVNDLAATGDLGNGEIVLYWKEQPNNGYPVTEYEIQYGTVSGGNFDMVYTDDAYPGARITGLTEGVPYQFRVVSRNQMGTSAVSNVVTATLQPAPEVDVVWTDLVNVSVDGNSITKTAPTFNRMDSGAASQQRVVGNGEILFTAAQTDKSIFCGLSYSNPDTFSSSMLYVIGLSSIGRYSIYESGMSRHISGYYYIGDIFSLERIGTTVTYKHNGVPIYTSSIASVGSFLVDAAIADSGATIADARIIDHSLGVPEAVDDLSASGNYKQVTLRWSEPADNSDPIQAYEVQYGTVASGLFDNIYTDDNMPGAVIAGLTNGVEYQFRVIARNSYGDSDPSNVDTAVPRADLLVNWIDPVGVAVDDNAFVKTSPSFAWDSGAVSETTFNGDGGVSFVIPQTSGNLMAGLAYPNPDTTYQSINYAVNTADNGNIYVYENGVSRGGFGAYQAGDQFSVERSGTTIIYKKDSEVFYTSAVPANGVLQVDSAVYTPGAGLSDAVITGFMPGAPDAVTQLHANPGNQAVTLYWEAPANNGAGITNYEIQYGTLASGLFDQTLNSGANQSVIVDNLNNGVEYQFRVIATNVDGPSAPSASVTAIPVIERDVVWMPHEGVTVTGNSITKNYSNSWNSGGSASMTRFAGDGGVEFTAAQTNKILACGISSSDTSYNYDEIDYAFYLGSAGDLYIYENGVSRGAFGMYQMGDRLRVERLGSTVFYHLNGALLYTSSVPSTGTLLVDSAMYSTNAQIQDATHVGLTWSLPTAVSDLVATPGSGEVQLAWTRAEMAEGYRIYYGTASGVYTDSVDAGAVENFTVTGLAANTRYYFVIKGYNYMGEGLSSNEVNAISDENQGTDISSNITADTTWTLAGSPYRVKTDISVQAGVTLTIEPGVEVRVRKLHGITVYGTLNAQGTSAQRILFASYYEDGVEDEIWLGVTFYGQGIISHCEFEGAFEGLIIDNASPTVEYSFFRGWVRIRNGSSAVISHNTFYAAIILQPSLAAPLNPVINDNDFIETGVVMFDIDGLDYSSIVINAENNWWGTADPLQIAEQIIDHNDNPLFVVVDFEPFQEESSRITISNVRVDPLVFSHYAGETTDIHYSLDHDGAVTVNIVDCQAWENIRTLVDSAPRTAGAHAETWDGRDDTSTPVSYDVYCYTISAVDSQDRYTYYTPSYVTGNADFLNYSITPESFDPYQNEVLTITYDLVAPAWVMMTVNEPRHVQEHIYEIDKLVAYQPRNMTNNIETWDGRAEGGLILDGEFEIAGWGTLLPDNAIILEPDFEITALTTAPYYMFPAYGEVTHIEFVLQADAVVNLEVLDLEAAPIRSLLSSELRTAGTHSDIIWDGKDDVGRIAAPAGNYTVRLTATSVLDNVTQVRYANITIFY